MNRRVFQFAIASLWLSLPLVALLYTQVWSQLPARLATHFNAANQVNGWMSRTEALNFAVGFTAFLLIIFTAVLLYIAHNQVDVFSWATLGFCALVLATMTEVNRGIVSYNLHGAPLALGTILIAVPIAAVLLFATYVVSRRETALSSDEATELLAEETHSGRSYILLFLPAILVPAIAVALVSVPAVRIAMATVLLIGLAIIGAAWTGFHYRFFRHGFEVSILGFRLRSIPRNQIQSYSAGAWSIWRGYGIRGIGNTRAYVWGNTVVHIKTLNGDIFLGTNDAQRTLQNLDKVTGALQHAGN
jgi:hypothetical protein